MRWAPSTAALTGIAIGLAAAIAFVALTPTPRPESGWDPAPLAGTLLPEDRGPLEEIAFHFVPDMAPIAEGVYRDFLPALDPATRLVAVVPDGAEGDLGRFLRSLPGGDALDRRTRVVPATGPVSVWSKDRSLVAAPARPGANATLLVPAAPSAPGSRRLNDWNTPGAIARAMPDRFEVRSVPLDFDAGDFAVAGKRVLVDANLFAKNHGRPIASPRALAEALARLFRREVVVLGEAEGDVPRHHLSMYLAPLDGGVVLVGEPAAALPVVGRDFAPGENSPETGEPLRADFSDETQARFERAAKDLTAAGFKVERIPTVAFDDKTYFAYTNGVFETRSGRRIAYMPTYGVPALDDAAAAVYERLGWEVRRVSARAAFPFHGTLGCLVNVLARGPDAPMPLAQGPGSDPAKARGASDRSYLHTIEP